MLQERVQVKVSGACWAWQEHGDFICEKEEGCGGSSGQH